MTHYLDLPGFGNHVAVEIAKGWVMLRHGGTEMQWDSVHAVRQVALLLTNAADSIEDYRLERQRSADGVPF